MVALYLVFLGTSILFSTHQFKFPTAVSWGFPKWLNVKKPAANAGDERNVGLISGSGRSPGEGNDNPL